MKATDNEGIGNRLLAALPPDELAGVCPHLTRVELAREQILHHSEVTLEHVYFPETAVLSYVFNTEDGVPFEVGLVGSNGVAGLCVALGTRRTPNHTEVLIGGSALRLNASVFEAEVRRVASLSRLALCYAQAAIVNAGQMQVCMRLHSLEERLACWLLLIYDPLPRKVLPLTQAAIGQMLGVPRNGVSASANQLRARGLIKYSRGNLMIQDRDALAEFACNCFQVVSEEYERVFSERTSGDSPGKIKIPNIGNI